MSQTHPSLPGIVVVNALRLSAISFWPHNYTQQFMFTCLCMYACFPLFVESMRQYLQQNLVDNQLPVAQTKTARNCCTSLDVAVFLCFLLVVVSCCYCCY